MDRSSLEGDHGDVNVEGIRERLDDEPIEYAVCFGSVAGGQAFPQSDVDIGLRFSETLSKRERFRERNQIDADLQGYASRFVDVSDL